MKLNPRTAGKLASLSALGAGALVVGMGEADATESFTPTTGSVGFVSGNAVSSFKAAGAGFGGAGVRLFTQLSFSKVSTYGSSGLRKIYFNGLGGVKFATTGGFGSLKLFPVKSAAIGGAGLKTNGLAGQMFWYHIARPRGGYSTPNTGTTGCGAPATGSHFVTTRSSRYNASSSIFPTGGGYTDKFALFNFTFGGNPYNGWVELTLTETLAGEGLVPHGPELMVVDSGFASPVPEPGTFAMTGLVALALGAAGIRRWRAARLAKTA